MIRITKYYKMTLSGLKTKVEQNAAAAVGSAAALCMAYIVTSFALNWRIVFWIGALIALIGPIARTALRETPEFANAKARVKKILPDNDTHHKILQDDPIWSEKPDKNPAWIVKSSSMSFPRKRESSKIQIYFFICLFYQIHTNTKVIFWIPAF
ncbi:MAG: hypothetical protein O7D30_04020, partial [Rickettsia endosymbiont of Ixodes persulcatus]|nr:hypothetical protein [Rickettsia endosymbiont of Ixodes persulcatus]